MKKLQKTLIICSGVVAGAAGVAGLAAISNAHAETIDTSKSVLAPVVAELTAAKNISASKDETVYAVAGADGAAGKLFVGNTLYTGHESLPFEMRIRYYLDGTEVSASEIAGKSGHIKIVFSYDSVKYYQGKKVPFVAVSGLMLDGDKFSNVSVSNGKMIDDGSRLAVVGYALPGANADLGTDFLPDTFTVEADVTGFELPVTYTVVTNEILTELDTSKLSSVDSLISSVNQLSSGLDAIITGASDLSDGLETLVAKSGALQTGADNLAAGLTALTANNDALNAGATATFNSLLKQVAAQIGTELTIENYATTLGYIIANTEDAQTKYGLEAALDSLNAYNEFYIGLAGYTAGVAQAAAGAAELAGNIPALIDGETTLYNGSVALKEGLYTFKTSGIDKLVSFANNDLDKFVRDARATVTVAQSYRHFSQDSASSVKFIVKTASVK